MSDELSGDRPPKSRSDLSARAADADMLLPGSLRTSLLRQLAPAPGASERVLAGITATLGGVAPTSPVVHEVDASMAVRAGQLKAGTLLGGTSLTIKVFVSSVLLASAVALTTMSVRRKPESRPAREPTAAPSVSPVEPQAPAAALSPASAAEVVQQPNVQADVQSESQEITSTQDSAAVRPSTSVPVVRRTRRVRTEAAAPAVAPVTEASAPAADRDEQEDAVEPAAKPTVALTGELVLVRSVSDALDRKDAKLALELLARYRQAYPAGSLSIEAQALHAIALCLDKRPQAASARAVFLREHGTSAIAARVRSACR